VIDVTRHRSVFDPTKWTNRIDIIGVGATGSKIALSLAKLGLRNLHVWDGDIVEAHNVANQAYDRRDIGERKTKAIRDAINRVSGISINPHDHWLPEHHARMLGEVVFCMVDSMKVRRQVFESMRTNLRTSLVVDSRMGVDHAQLLTYQPRNEESMRAYEATLFSDDVAKAEVSACGTAITVGPTGDIISGYAVWHFIKHVACEPVEREIVLGARLPSLEVL
jgi:molybdopterin/thiamine biosynthesis adenylyltransferase